MNTKRDATEQTAKGSAAGNKNAGEGAALGEVELASFRRTASTAAALRAAENGDSTFQQTTGLQSSRHPAESDRLSATSSSSMGITPPASPLPKAASPDATDPLSLFARNEQQGNRAAGSSTDDIGVGRLTSYHRQRSSRMGGGTAACSSSRTTRVHSDMAPYTANPTGQKGTVSSWPSTSAPSPASSSGHSPDMHADQSTSTALERLEGLSADAISSSAAHTRGAGGNNARDLRYAPSGEHRGTVRSRSFSDMESRHSHTVLSNSHARSSGLDDPASEAVRADASVDAGTASTSSASRPLVPEQNWRDMMADACANLVSKSIHELEMDYNRLGGPGSGDLAPRDFTDYAIMSTLQSYDTFAIHNAPSWLFNTMDRSGSGHVLRDEFVKYTPFMAPVADAAVARSIFEELIRAQVAAHVQEEADLRAEELEREKHESHGFRFPWFPNPEHNRPKRRQRPPLPERVRSAATSSRTPMGVDSQGRPPESAPADLYPISVALRYPTWKAYFDKIQQLSKADDEDWDHVRYELGLDPTERLITSEGAVDHSDILPTLGKLYLSQRYLVFFAAVGRNHYVARLGSVLEVGQRSMPLLMRDCFTVKLSSETQAAMDGLSAPATTDGGALNKPDNGTDGQGRPDSHSTTEGGASGKRNNGGPPWAGPETPTPTHVKNLMRQFSGGGKPLVFSLIELRDTRRRDNWMAIIRELAQAHRLHVTLGFGSSGRVVPRLYSGEISAQGSSNPGGITEIGQGLRADNDSGDNISSNGDSPRKQDYMVYLMSPFRNEAPPPLLAVAAHANVLRYLALKSVKGARNPSALLVFSHAERSTRAVNWYVDSVRAHDDRAGRSWIERAMGAIRENMELNKRVYNVQDDEPFDVARLGEGIGRLAELCTPLARAWQFYTHLVQWRNPPATVLALLFCLYVVYMGWVQYIPAMALFSQSALIVVTKTGAFGLDKWMWGGGRPEDAEERQANVLELVSQVHDTLCAAQNVIRNINLTLGKVQALCLWGTGEMWQSWIAVGVITLVGGVLFFVEARLIFAIVVFMAFAKHFLPPNNVALKYWSRIPTRVQAPSQTASPPQRQASSSPAHDSEKKER